MTENYEEAARRALNKAANDGAGLGSIKYALVGIGFALLHSTAARFNNTYEQLVDGDDDGLKF